MLKSLAYRTHLRNETNVPTTMTALSYPAAYARLRLRRDQSALRQQVDRGIHIRRSNAFLSGSLAVATSRTVEPGDAVRFSGPETVTVGSWLAAANGGADTPSRRSRRHHRCSVRPASIARMYMGRG